MTMHDERRMSDLLHAVNAPRHQVDLSRAVADGRRTRRRRRVATATAGLAAVVVLLSGLAATRVLDPSGGRSAPPPADRREVPTPTVPTVVIGPPLDCKQVKLGAVRNGPARLLDIDPTGRYLLADRFAVPASASPPLLFDGVEPTDLAVPFVADAVAVNASGVVTGMVADRPWLLQDGELTYLSVPDGLQTVSVSGINGRGDVMGSFFRQSQSSVVVWWAGQPDRPTLLPGAARGPQVFLTDDGTVVGVSLGEAGGSRPARWSRDGTKTWMALPDGLVQAVVTHVKGGWAVGYAETGRAAPSRVALRWRLDTGAVESLAPQLALAATATGEPDPGAAPVPGSGATSPGSGHQFAALLAVGADGQVLVRDNGRLVLVPGPDGGAVRSGAAPAVPADPVDMELTGDGLLIGGGTGDGPTGAPVLLRC